MAAGFVVVYLLAGGNPIAYLGAFLAMTPDGLTLIYIVFPKNKPALKHFYYHNKVNEISEKRKFPVFWGIFCQLTIIAIAVYFLL